MKWASCPTWERATFVCILVTLSPWKYLLIVSLPAMIADTLRLKIWWMKSVVLRRLCGRRGTRRRTAAICRSRWVANELLAGEDTKIGREYWQAGYLCSSEFNLLSKNQPDGESEFQPQFFTIHPDLVGRMIAQARQTQMLLSLHFTSLLAGSPVASHQSLGCCDRYGLRWPEIWGVESAIGCLPNIYRCILIWKKPANSVKY